jgi:hypothetical protein
MASASAVLAARSLTAQMCVPLDPVEPSAAAFNGGPRLDLPPERAAGPVDNARDLKALPPRSYLRTRQSPHRASAPRPNGGTGMSVIFPA